ncbi:hypothetical protein [Xanthobacter sp.]|uniref:hypothetical protein n=1 Tax=Xanthobacter sp. TaxID=35809 RepID=UPI0035B191AD
MDEGVEIDGGHGDSGTVGRADDARAGKKARVVAPAKENLRGKSVREGRPNPPGRDPYGTTAVRDDRTCGRRGGQDAQKLGRQAAMG